MNTKSIARADNAGLVQIQRGELWTTSLVIAEKFGKRHKNVLRDIQRRSESKVTGQFSRLNFEPRAFSQILQIGSRSQLRLDRLFE